MARLSPADFVKPYRIKKGKGFKLSAFNPADTNGFDFDKDDAEALLREGVERFSDLQEKLYAQDRWSLLIIVQAMDAAGKDGVIKHVMSGINPQGCQVTAFKAPTSQELDHDFLWRCQINLPERGRIGIFNRSYYEEVLVVRVHEQILRRQKLPPDLVTDDIWRERFEDISGFERYLARNGTAILKFFLYVSKDEQKQRFLERIDDPAKNWKFSAADVAERGHWDSYMAAYEDMIRHTASKEAPWHVVPADNKHFARLVVVSSIIARLQKLDLAFPTLDDENKAQLAKCKRMLLGEKD